MISKDQYNKSEDESFLKKVYDGALDLLVAKFLEEKDLSMDQIEQLENILKDKKENKSSD